MAKKKITNLNTENLNNITYVDTEGNQGLGVVVLEGADITVDSEVQGDIAHDAADSGNPVKLGGKAYSSTPTSVANGDRVNAYFDTSGRLHVIDENITSLPKANYFSPIDFTATYTSNVTITISDAPFTVADANCFISYIYYLPSGGSWNLLVNGVNGVSFTSAANVITVTGAGTPFAAGDTYVIGILAQDKAYDTATSSQKNTILNPEYSQYVAVQNLVTAQNITNVATDVGSEIDCRGYKTIALYCNLTAGTSTNSTIQVLSKHTSAGADEYIMAATADYQLNLGSADTKIVAKFDISGIPYVQVQVFDDADGTGTITVDYVLEY